MTSLGERLKAINQQTEEDRRVKEARDRAAADAQVAADIQTVRDFFDAARLHIERAIEAGRAPAPLKLGRGNHANAASLLKTYNWPHGPIGGTEIRTGAFWHTNFFPAWLEFEKWTTESGLSAKFHYSHDGCGRESWYELVVTPR